jgi:hypothetical protein
MTCTREDSKAKQIQVVDQLSNPPSVSPLPVSTTLRNHFQAVLLFSAL